MAKPLRNIVRDTPAGFDLRSLPYRAWRALSGAFKALFSIGTIVFIVVALILIVASYLYIDRPLAQWLNKFQNSGPTNFFRAITDLGSVSVLIALPLLAAVALLVVALAMRQSRHFNLILRNAGRAFFVFCCVAAPAAVGLIAKIAIGRARPQILFDGGGYGFTPMTLNYLWHSMPSGHSLGAAGFAAGIALVLPLPALPFVAFFGAMIAVSRVASTAHFFGDAVAGGALAIVCALMVKGAFRGAGMKPLFPDWDPNRKLRAISRSLFTR